MTRASVRRGKTLKRPFEPNHLEPGTAPRAGREDGVIPFEQSEHVRRAAPQAEIVALDDVGHLAPVERPRETSQALAAFFLARARR